MTYRTRPHNAPTTRRNGSTLLAVVAVVLLLAACESTGKQSTPNQNAASAGPADETSQATPVPSEPTVTPTGDAIPTEGLIDALLASRLSAQDEYTLQSALELLISDCMQVRGFEYTPLPSPLEDIRRDFASVRREFDLTGLVTVEDGAVSYGVESVWSDEIAMVLGGESNPDPPDPNSQHIRSLSPDEQQRWSEAYNGSPNSVVFSDETDEGAGEGMFAFSDGCIAHAEQILFENIDYSEYLRLLDRENRALSNVTSRIFSDAELLEASADWATCMAGLGYDYSHPRDALSFLIGEYATAPDIAAVRSLETTIATADSECRKQSGLERVHRDTVSDAAREALVAGEADLLTLNEIRERATDAARRVLGAG